MFTPAFTTFLSWLFKYRYLALFPTAVFEGPIITIAAGFLASLKVFDPFIALAVVIAGDLAGDSLHYAAGRWGGRKFIEKWGRFVGLSMEKIEPLEKLFAQKGNSLLFVGKALHGIGGAFLVAAGLIHMPFKKFFFSNFWATLLKSAVLLLIGFYFGQALSHIKSFLDALAVGLAAAFIIFILIYFFYLKDRRKNL